MRTKRLTSRSLERHPISNFLSSVPFANRLQAGEKLPGCTGKIKSQHTFGKSCCVTTSDIFTDLCGT